MKHDPMTLEGAQKIAIERGYDVLRLHDELFQLRAYAELQTEALREIHRTAHGFDHPALLRIIGLTKMALAKAPTTPFSAHPAGSDAGVKLTPAETVRYDPAPECKGEIAARERLEPEGRRGADGTVSVAELDARNGVTGRRDDHFLHQSCTHMDKGPWKWEMMSNGRAHVYSDDFTHDVRLEVSGLFHTDAERRAYAESLAAALNGTLRHQVNRWISADERLPAEEGRYFIIYRHAGGRIHRPYVGDYSGGEWCGMPRDCTVWLWMPVPDYEFVAGKKS